MTLDSYLTGAGLTEAAFGVLVGLSQSQINRIRTGRSWPPRDVAERIREVTAGKVTPDDFLPPQATPESSSAAPGEAAA